MKRSAIHFISFLILFSNSLFAQVDQETPVPVVNIGHQYPIIMEKFGHNSNRLMTLDGCGILKVWDVESGGNISTISSPSGKIISAEFSEKDNWIVAKTRANSLKTLYGEDVYDMIVFKSSTGEMVYDGVGDLVTISTDENWIFSTTLFSLEDLVQEQKCFVEKYNLITNKQSRIIFFGRPLMLENDYVGYYSKKQFVLLNILTGEKNSIALIDDLYYPLTKCRIVENDKGLIFFCTPFENEITDSALYVRDSVVVVAKRDPSRKGLIGIQHWQYHQDSSRIQPYGKQPTYRQTIVAVADDSVIVNFAGNPVHAYSFKNNQHDRNCFLVITDSIYAPLVVERKDKELILVEKCNPGIFDSKIDSFVLYKIDQSGKLRIGSLTKKEKTEWGSKLFQSWSYDQEKTNVVFRVGEFRNDSIIGKNIPMDSKHSTAARLSFSSDLRFSVITDSSSLSVHDFQSGVLLRKLGVTPSPIIFFACTQSRERIFLVLPNSILRIYNFKLVNVETEIKFPKENIAAVFPSYDGSKFLLQSADSLWAYVIGSKISVEHFFISDPEAGKFIGMKLPNLKYVDTNSFVFENRGSIPSGIFDKVDTLITYSIDRYAKTLFISEGNRITDMHIISDSLNLNWYLDNEILYEGKGILKKDICFSKSLQYVVVNNSETQFQNESSDVLTNLMNCITVYETYPTEKLLKIKVKGPVDTLFIDSTDNDLFVIYKNTWGTSSEVFHLKNGKILQLPQTGKKFNAPVANHGIVTTRQNDFTLEMQLFNQYNRTAGWLYNTTETVFFIMPCSYYHVDKNNLDAMSFRYKGVLLPIEKYDVYFNNPGHVTEAHLDLKDSALYAIYHTSYQKRLAKAGIKDQGPFIVRWKKTKGGYWPNSGPKIFIENKNEIPVSVTDSLLSISILIKDSLAPISSYSIKINGIPIWGTKGKQFSKDEESFSVNEKVQLTRGMNRIVVSAKDTNGVEGTSQELFVNYNPQKKSLPRLFFVGIGVSDYNDSTYKLNYAAKDVHDMATMLSKSKFYSSVSIDTLINKKATLENILAVKKHLLESTPDDVVILYVSGHGLLDDSLDFFYATCDIDFSQPSVRGISFDALEEILDSIPARQKLMLMDACHSGEVDKDMFALMNGQNSLAMGTKGVVKLQSAERGVLKISTQKNENAFRKYQLIGDMFVNFSSGTGATVISASSGYGFALESPEWNNGVFTYCFINALQNEKADADKNGEVSIKELKYYLQQNVELLTEGKQKPNIRKEVLENDWRIY